jgi:hypothetical protein
MSNDRSLSPLTAALMAPEPRRWVIPTLVDCAEVGAAFLNCRESPSSQNSRNHLISAMYPWMNPKDRVLFFGLKN